MFSWGVKWKRWLKIALKTLKRQILCKRGFFSKIIMGSYQIRILKSAKLGRR